MAILSRANAVSIKPLLSLVLLVAINARLFAGEIPYLERQVSLNVNNQSIADVFKAISNQTGVQFSYNPQQFNDGQRISLWISKKPLRVALAALIKSPCGYRLKKQYIIIKCGSPAQEPKKSTYLISGYLVSTMDSSRIANASVFVKTTRQATITDDFGHFQLTAQKEDGPLHISIAKENYTDTALLVAETANKELWIYLSPVPPKKIVQVIFPDSVPQLKDTIVLATVATADTGKPVPPTSKFWERQKQLNANLRNIRDTMFSKVSFSLIPPISTNNLLSFNTINAISLNLLIGKSKGVNGVEIGGLLNYDYGDVKFVQVGGLANVVAGNVKYFQAGGLFNSVLGNVEGLQAGGLFNTVTGNVKGLQAGGLFNTVMGDIKGLQAGGLFNEAGNYIEGVQAAGIFNHARSVNGAQLGGIYNYVTDTIKDLQVAGMFNKAGYARGLQLAGILNIADKTEGVQLSGLVNYAKNVTGWQISPFNFADSCRKGIPVGVFSYVKSGYHKIEIAGDELQNITLGFRTGVEKFHNIIFGGYGGFQQQKLWTYGYGLGFYRRLTPRKGVYFDITAQQLQNTQAPKIWLNLLTRLNASYSYAVSPKFSVAIGPTFNSLNSDVRDAAFNQAFDKVAPTTFFNTRYDNSLVRMWVGGKLSVKFL